MSPQQSGGRPSGRQVGRGRRLSALLVLLAVVAVVAVVAQNALLVLGLAATRPPPLLYLAPPGLAILLPVLSPGLDPVVARLRRVPVAVLAAGVVLGVAATWLLLQGAIPVLGHDEAVYAAKARSWATGLPPAQWRAYRPVALPALGRVALEVHDSVGAVRAVGLALAVAAALALLAVAASWTSARRAVVVATLVFGSTAMVRRVPEFLDDIGSSALLLVVVWAVAAAARERPGSRRLAVAALAAVAAFYLRYGVVAGLLVVAVAAVVVWGPSCWWRRRLDVAVALAVLLAGLAPHLVWASRETGRPWGVLTSAGAVAGQSYPGQGLVYYAAAAPFRLAGDLEGLIVLAGVAALLPAVRRLRAGSATADDRRSLFLGLTALATTVVLGLAAHGEPRFVLLPVMLLTVLGVQAVAHWSGRRSGAALLVVGALAVVAAAGDVAWLRGDGAPHAASSASLEAAARAVPAQRPCRVVTSYEPELGWYSGCATAAFSAVRAGGLPRGPVTVTLVLFERGRRQPGRVEWTRWVAGRHPIVRTLPARGSLGRVTLVTVRS